MDCFRYHVLDDAVAIGNPVYRWPSYNDINAESIIVTLFKATSMSNSPLVLALPYVMRMYISYPYITLYHDHRRGGGGYV